MFYEDHTPESAPVPFYDRGTFFKVFREAYLVAGDYPQEKMYLLQHLFNNWYRDLSLDKMSAAAVVTGLVIFLLILGLWKAWGKGGAE